MDKTLKHATELFAVLVILCSSRALAYQSTNLAPAGAAPGTNIVYAKIGDRELHINLVLPKQRPAGPLPVIVWIHGGGWRIGDYTRNRAAWFAEHGYAAASIEYRFLDVALLPAQVYDCKAAIRFLRANAKKLGLDPNHIGVWGGSAGGHLAALIGTSADIKELDGDLGSADQSSRVQAVSPWYGLYDMTAGNKERKKDSQKPDPYIEFLGGTFAEKRDLAKLVSACTHASKDDPPFLIVHGEIDRTMPIRQAELLNDALSKVGVDATFIRVKNGNHNLTAPDMDPNMDEIERRMLEFFDKHLKPPVSGAASVVSLPFVPADSGWAFHGTGQFEGWPDRRDLFVLYHPWSAARGGSFGTVSREVEIPSGWSGQTRLHFYMTDDYNGSDAPLDKKSWLGQIKLVGHRFKQVLADDEVIWERDVADAADILQTNRFSVLLPEKFKPGMRFRLSFKLLDKVGTDQRLPEDYRHIGSYEGIKESDEWKFRTHLYVGDVSLAPADVESVLQGEPPSATLCRTVHQQRWPLKPYGNLTNLPVALQWERWTEMVSQTCAIHCGIPLPAGMFTDTKQVGLRDRTGKSLPLQIAPMNRWPDGSLRWVELDTVAEANEQTRELMLERVVVASPSPACDEPVGVRSQDGNAITIQSGKLKAVVGGDGGSLLRRLVQGRGAVENLMAELVIESKVYRPEIATATVIAKGPLRTEVELSGQLASGDDRIGRCVFRLAAFAGQPYVRMTWRIFNDCKDPLKVSRFQLIARCNLGTEVTSRWGNADKAGDNRVRLRQLKEDQFEVLNGAGAVIDTGSAAPGWLAAVGRNQTLMLLVRHFREQFPKALELAGNELKISLFESSPDEPFYLPTEGEAKRHDIWLGLWDRSLTTVELDTRSRYFAHPARLFSADYACASGGFGYMARHDRERFPEFDEIVRGLYGDIPAKLFYVNGIRNWGDKPYGTNWCNGYYDVQQGLAAEYVMSGDPRWFDHLEASVRHIIDVDVCHASQDHPGWIGAIHGGHDGPNHTASAPWNPTQRTKGTLAYWRLTADRDARDAALGVADAALRENRCVGNCQSVRDHAGILYCLTSAFDETRDTKYLQAAKRVAHDAIRRIDRRRGCYGEVHGNISYRGNVPWMVAQLSEGMYEYYRQSGDVEAAIAVVGLAESILTENRTRDVPGDVYGYSHNPHNKKVGDYHVAIAPAVLHAYELTGDEFYLVQGRAMYAQMIRERKLNDVRNCYWTAPTLLYYLTQYGKGDGGSKP